MHIYLQDQVVRTKGMEMLMSFARTFTDRQYVFITPQAIGYGTSS